MRAPIRLYLAGLTASLVGSSAMTLVAGVWVKSLTGSSRLAALVSVCVYIPSLLAPVAGLVVDRVSRQRLLVLVNLAAAACVLPLVQVTGRDDVWMIVVAMLGYGVALVLIDPAETALFTELAPPAEQGTVNGLRLTIQEGAKLVAPLGGAALFTVLGGGAVAVADAASFVVAAVVTALIRRPTPVPVGGGGKEPWRAAVTAGLRHVWRTPELRPVVVTAAVAVAVSGVVVAAQYSLVDALGRPPAFLGVLTSLLGAGSILAGLASGPLLRRVGERRLALFGLLNGGVGYLMAATDQLVVVCAGRLLQGFFLPWLVVAAISAGQRLTPDRLQGRVAAAVTLLMFATQPAAQAGGAALLGVVDHRVVYVLAAAASLALLGLLRSRPAGTEA